MTTDPEFPTNHALVVGRLGSFAGARDASGARQPLKTITRRGEFGRGTRFLIELATPLGEPFDLTIEASPATAGMAALEAAGCGDWIAVEGTLTLATAFQRRGAAEGEAGHEVRDLVVRASSIREAAPGEQRCQAHASLEGVVLEPAVFVRHAAIRSAQFGRTHIRTTVGPHQVTYEVACTISTQHDSAGLLYRAGNRLQLRGDITRMATLQFGSRVDEALAQLQREWDEQRAALEHAPEDEQRRAAWRYRARRDALLYQAHTSVLVDTIVPLPGAQAVSFAQARRLRREFAQRARDAGLPAARAPAAQCPWRGHPRVAAPERHCPRPTHTTPSCFGSWGSCA